MAKPHLLIIEDEDAILRGLADTFAYHGYQISTARDGETGLSLAFTVHPDLVILDIMLPKKDGFTVCNEIRSVTRDLPIIILTAKSTDEDIVHGFTLGADDYVAKPFSITELVLRVEAVLRRTKGGGDDEVKFVVGGNIEIDSANLIGRGLNGDQITFTRREVKILEYLRKCSNRPVSRGELLQEVWGYRRSSEIDTRTVDIHLAKLRRKIEPDAKNPTYLVTVRGEGYRLIDRPDTATRNA